MNRLLILFSLFLPILCYSQPKYDLCIQVVGINGGSGAQGNYKVAWTVGEFAISSLSGDDYKVTQGFHQPDICALVSTSDLDLEALGIEVFPNPTSSFLTVRYTDSGKSSLRMEVFNLLGKRIHAPTPLNIPEGTRLDATEWPAGVYFLRISDTKSNAMATVRVIRL